MKIYIAESLFSQPGETKSLQGILDYVNLLSNFYELDALPPQALEIYHIDSYRRQVEPSGHQTFFRETKFNANQNQFILNGLTAMGLEHHKKIFQASLDLMNALPKPYRDVIIHNPYCNADDSGIDANLKKAVDYLKKMDIQFRAASSLVDACDQYIRKMKDVEIVPDHLLGEKFKTLIESSPVYQKILEMQKENKDLLDTQLDEESKEKEEAI